MTAAAAAVFFPSSLDAAVKKQIIIRSAPLLQVDSPLFAFRPKGQD
jgi:hypothetical protein